MFNKKYLYFKSNNNLIIKIPNDVQESVQKTLDANESAILNDAFLSWMKFMNFNNGQILKPNDTELIVLEVVKLNGSILANQVQSNIVSPSTTSKSSTAAFLTAAFLMFIGVIAFIVGMTTIFDWGIIAVIFGIFLFVLGILVAKGS